MPLEQAATEQPEVKSYDQEMHDDVRAAFTEVTSRTAETPAEKPINEKLDDISQPLEKALKPATERTRDEQGRFAKTEDKPASKQDDKASAVANPTPAAAAVPVANAPAAAPGQAPEAVKSNPPGEWEPKAKAQWERLPQVVRDAIGRSTAADPSIMELKPFIDRAKQSGQSLAQALNAYTGMEALIKRDPAGGMMHVAQNLGLTQHQAGHLFLDLAQRLGVLPQAGSHQQVPPANGHDAPQEPDFNRALAPVLNPFQQRLDTLESYIRQQHEALQGQRLTSSMSAVEKFRSSPEARYYDNVEKDIANLLDRGVVPRTGDYLTDLKAAYETACWQNPEIRQILIAEQAEQGRVAADAAAKQAAEKARQASRSVTGSPSPGAGPGSARKANGKSYDEDLHNDVLDAVRQVSGRA